MIKIPVDYVPRAPVDFDAEAHQILGHCLVLSDGFRVPPLTAARLVALEIVSSPFFMHPDTCDMIDAAAAVVLLSCSRELCEELTRPARTQAGGAETDPRFDALRSAASTWLLAHGEALAADYSGIVAWICGVPFYGFLMRPGTPGKSKPFIFDGAYLGGVIGPAARILATPVDTVLWETPLCLVGHAVAQHDASLGVKGVERPPDKAVLDRMMREAAKREARGELHPWQYDDPVSNPLTDLQVQADPSLIARYGRIRQIYESNGHRPVDPNLVDIPSASSAEPADTAPDLSSLSAREAERTAAVQDLSWSAREAERTAAVKDLSLYVCGSVPSAGAAERISAVQDLSWSAREAERTAAVKDLSLYVCGSVPSAGAAERTSAVQDLSWSAREAERTATVEEHPHHG